MTWKKFAHALLYPHPVLLALLTPAATVFLAYCLMTQGETSFLSIASYLVSFYTLAVIVLRLPGVVKSALRFKRENRYLARYSSDVRLRMNISLYASFAVGVVYAVFQLALGVVHRSAWFYSMAAYYLLLAVMRLMLARYTTRHVPGEQLYTEWKTQLACGACILVMTLSLTVFIAYFILKIRTFAHHEITTIAMAAYTFTSLTGAIIETVRSRRFGSPVRTAAKEVSLVSAVVSMLTLENAMLTTFGTENDESFRRIMLALTGLAVILTVQTIAIRMIVSAQRYFKTHPQNNEQESEPYAE